MKSWSALALLIVSLGGCTKQNPGANAPDLAARDGAIAPREDGGATDGATVDDGGDDDGGDDDGGTLPGSDLTPACGNGIVDDGETCDTAILDGAGACPTSCDDGDACTTDVPTGDACTIACEHTAITGASSDDGCCPDGADSTTDNDCLATCGNSLVEDGETCDTAITSGRGACPTACADLDGCTTDALVGGGTCGAACTFTPITVVANGDGCCPAGEDSTTDDDCVPGCGDGILDDGETCDTAITAGAGQCPLTCSDGIACTTDTLSNPNTCTAACTFPAITMAADGDGCCPTGANATTDNDCASMCGNNVREPGEECDFGNPSTNALCSDGCKGVPTAFRMNDLDLRDPHIFVDFVGCRDVTDTPFIGFSINGALQEAIQTDTDNDGRLELSIATIFRPLDQVDDHSTTLVVGFPQCTAPMSSTTCSMTADKTTTTSITHASTTCLVPIPGTVRPYVPAITQPTGPCYQANVAALTINVAGIPIKMTSVSISATFVGTPAGNTTNGLLRGFVSVADADATIIPASFPIVGGQALSSLLPGGDPPGDDNANCAPHSDRDMNGTVPGWWFYFNFTAPRVTLIDN